LKQICFSLDQQSNHIILNMSNGKSLAYVANASKEQLKLQTIDLPPLDDDGVEIKVRYW